MSSVTERIKMIHQPRGGYVNPKLFSCAHLEDQGILVDYKNENIHPTKMGLIVDYMTRFCCGTPKKEAFKISLEGAKIAEEQGIEGSVDRANELLGNITSDDDSSLKSAYNLVGYDVWFRQKEKAMQYYLDAKKEKAESEEEQDEYVPVSPDEVTCDNLRTMIENGVNFFGLYGPVTSDGFTFEDENASDEIKQKFEARVGNYGGYTPTVDSGDGDFLTEDTLWDFKVSVKGPTSAHSLQLMMYYIMGLHSGQAKYKKLKKLGIYNPRLNNVYLYEIKDIPKEVLEIIEKEIICY